MNKSQRIFLNTNDNDDKHFKIKLEQDVDFFEIMSMKIDTKEFYENFNANYGVLVGRVIGNEGIGIPNAKISIFIPLQEEDRFDRTITNLYPYNTPRDKNVAGKRYNLLPRVSSTNPEDGRIKPTQPFGSFPIKPEIVTNPTFLRVYDKYYRFTATTNEFGDYMIFGVPVGVQTVHMSMDITDIGKYSMSPPSMVTDLGFSPNLFVENNTRIKPTTDLDKLPNIETQEISVDVIPFWGDTNNFEIGITRQDFNVRAVLVNTITIFGTSFTDEEDVNWGGASGDTNPRNRFYRIRGGNENLSLSRKRISNISEKIFYYPSNLSDEYINSDDCDPINDAILLDPSEYSSYKRDGDFVFIIAANRRRVIIDEFGNEQVVPPNTPEGIFTEFRGFIIFEYGEDDLPVRDRWIVNNASYHQIRYRFKIPQYSNTIGRHLKEDGTADADVDNKAWRKQDYTFKGGKIYSVSRFISTNYIPTGTESHQSETGLLTNEVLNEGRAIGTISPPVPQLTYQNIVGLLFNYVHESDEDTVSEANFPDFTGSTSIWEYLEFPSNANENNIKTFGGNWMNFAIYFPQVARNQATRDTLSNIHATTNFQRTHRSYFFIDDNTQPIAGGFFNTKWMARNDLNWLDFIEVDMLDLQKMKNVAASNEINRGFTKSELDTTLNGDYRNGINPPSWGGVACPQGGGRLGGNPDSTVADEETYFYRGWGSADCLQYLQELNLI